MKSIFNLINNSAKNSKKQQIQFYAEKARINVGASEGQTPYEVVENELNQTQEYVHALLTGHSFDGTPMRAESISFKEMLASSDISAIFPRVISNVLLEAKEPNLFLLNQVAEILPLADDAPLSLSFLTASNVQAYEISEGQEYRVANMAIQENNVNLRLKKWGLMSSLSEEVIRHSMFPLLEMHLRNASNAIDRAKESQLYAILTQKANTIFDNDLGNGDVSYRTTGVSSNQQWNGSLALKDILTLAGTVVAQKYEPTHMLIHPLAYLVIFSDPLIRATFFHQGSLGTTINSQLPQFDQSANMPFALQYVPYYALPYSEGASLVTDPGSAFPTKTLITDVYVLDKNNSMFLSTRGEKAMDKMDDWYKDATSIKVRQYFGTSAKDGGRAMVCARNVRVVENFTPLTTIRMTSA